MIEFIYQFSKPIKILVSLTMLFALYNLKWKNKTHKLLMIILLKCFSMELTNSILRFHNKSIDFASTIGVVIHHGLWLFLLAKNAVFHKTAFLLLCGFLIFAITNFIFFYGTQEFNYYTFVVGAFLYIIIFIYESFYQLRQENFDFFLSNTFILLTAPVLFFFGYSFMFGFNSKNVTSYLLFGHLKLHTLISSFVNIIYYALIILYIYREKKLKNAK